MKNEKYLILGNDRVSLEEIMISCKNQTFEISEGGWQDHLIIYFEDEKKLLATMIAFDLCRVKYSLNEMRMLVILIKDDDGDGRVSY